MRFSKTSKNNKMLLASRANPPRPLGDFPKSSHLSVRQLLINSPLPSPALPALLPRHGKKPPKLNTRKALRLLLWLSIVTTFYYVGSLTFGSHTKALNIRYLTSSGKTYEIVGDVNLPDFPTPFSFPDEKGRSRWTVYIPQQLEFPLHAADYVDICSHSEEVARHAGNHGANHQHLHKSDSHYLDVDEAQLRGFLPQQIHMAHPGEDFSLTVCEKSLTFVLDGTDAGLGSTMLGLWLSYSLAKKEKRSFFIEDSLFAYSEYTTYFQPPERPTCRPPPKTQRVPCPLQAKHLIVSAATYPWMFGRGFLEGRTQREIFDMARAGYEALFKLNTNDASYIQQRVAKIGAEKFMVGVHVRRGDRHPLEFAYSQGYLQSHKYSDAVEVFAKQPNHPKIVIASDDPDTYAFEEFKSYTRAQDQIALVSKKTSGSLGWEGGFFKDQFWSLGLPLEAHEQKRIGSPLPTRQKNDKATTHKKSRPEAIRDYRTHPTEEAKMLRELIGRAYLMELSILGHSDRVVCAVSSYTCRILAVMLGWERAIEQGHWKNVDGNYDWFAFDR